MEIQYKPMTKNDSYNNGRKNDRSAIMIHSTCTPGIMAAAWFERWNKSGLGKSAHVFVDDKEAFQYLEWDTRGAHAGGTANDTHIAVEMCEPSGHTYTSSGQMVDYDPVKNQAYFNAVWKNTVEICAFLCVKFGIDPGKIICHADGYKAGIASDHSDVLQWFPKHGKTMQNFRDAVSTLLNPTVAPVFYGGALYIAPEKKDVYQTSALSAKIGSVSKGETVNLLYGQGDLRVILYDITDSKGDPTGEKKVGFIKI